MAKLKNPLFGFNVRGTLGRALSFRKRGSQTIAEKKPIPPDAKSLAQLSWRHMYQKAVALWHGLSAAEQAEWESQARVRHMTGFAWFMSQCLKPNPGLYLPLQGGVMSGNIDMATHKITDLPQPLVDQEAATKKYVDDSVPPTPSHIEDSDGDTYFTTEKTADKDTLEGYVKNVLAFLIADTGVLTLPKQSAIGAYKTTDTQTLVTGTPTKIILNAEYFDIQSEFDSAVNYRFTCKTAGLYLLTGVVSFYPSVVQKRYITYIYRDGASMGDEVVQSSMTNWIRPKVVMLAQLAVDDEVELWGKHDAGVNQIVAVGSTRLYAIKIA